MSGTSEAATRVYLKKGEPAPFSGWLFTEQRTSEMALGWQRAASESDAWKSAFYELKAEVTESTEMSRMRLKDLQLSLESERRTQRKKQTGGVLVGVVLGCVIGAVIHNNVR